MKQKHNWLLDCCVKLKTKKRNTCVPIKSKKNRQIITFQAAKIQHKPRCVPLKNGENLNKICISALLWLPSYTQWGQNYFEVAFHIFPNILDLSIYRSKTILDKFKFFWTCPKNFWKGPNFVFGPIKGQPNGFKRLWNTFQCVIKVNKSQKKNTVSSILPKNERSLLFWVLKVSRIVSFIRFLKNPGRHNLLSRFNDH